MGVINGILTAVLMLVFVGIVVWAWQSKRKRHFDAAAALPLEEDKVGSRNHE